LNKIKITGADSAQGDYRQTGMRFVQPVDSVDSASRHCQLENDEGRRLRCKRMDERVSFLS
jgi:hypothetical protein